MLRTRHLRVLVVAVILCLPGLAGVAPAQGRRDQALARVREVRERHTQKMMAKAGIVGTAVGLDESGDYVVPVLLEGPNIRDIPADLEGIPVRPIVTEDGNHPVGLLFAGGDIYTVANPIDLVLSRFGVTVDGQ